MGNCHQKRIDRTLSTERTDLSPLHKSVQNGINLKKASIGPFYMKKLIKESSPQQKRIWTSIIYHHQTLSMPITNEDQAYDNTLLYYSENTEEFISQMEMGPPAVIRWMAWKIALNYKRYYQPGVYEKAKSQDVNQSLLRHVDKDADRTFPHHPFFGGSLYGKIGQDAIKSILDAYGNKNPNIGYCQGMNFYIGFMLIISGFREEEVFWMFQILTNQVENMPSKCSIEGFFTDNSPLLECYIKNFEKLFAAYIPKLKERFDSIQFYNDYWLRKWIMLLFVDSFPNTFCIRIWDALLANGLLFILRIILALLKGMESKLLPMSIDEVHNYFKSNLCHEHLVANPSLLIQNAKKMNIDWQLCKDNK